MNAKVGFIGLGRMGAPMARFLLRAGFPANASSAVGSRFVDYKRQAFVDPVNEPVAFTLELMRKDLGLEIELGRRLGVPLPGVGSADQMLTVARGLRGDEADLAGVAGAVRHIATAMQPEVAT
jgi:3-hydroxyisobutyrate dehydrogenase-like beta-hydroxyacid dehydrogenase